MDCCADDRWMADRHMVAWMEYCRFVPQDTSVAFYLIYSGLDVGFNLLHQHKLSFS